jgi:hypothetical protein
MQNSGQRTLQTAIVTRPFNKQLHTLNQRLGLLNM